MDHDQGSDPKRGRMHRAGVLRDLMALLVVVAVLVVGVVLLGTVVACWRSGAAW